MRYEHDITPLTAEEIAFQCVALSNAAFITREHDLKEALILMMLERSSLLYTMLPECADSELCDKCKAEVRTEVRSEVRTQNILSKCVPDAICDECKEAGHE